MQESVSRSMSRTPDGISDQFGAQSSGLRARQTEIRAPKMRIVLSLSPAFPASNAFKEFLPRDISAEMPAGMAPSWLIALACVMAAASAIQPEVDGHVVEPASSIKFPATVPGESGSMHLLGTAIRVKKIVMISVQVYAVGLYVDRKILRERMVPEIKSATFSTLLSEDANVPLTIRIEMARSVGGDTMSGALKDAIEPRLKKLYNDDAAKTAKDMEAFTKQFDMSNLDTGTVLTFHKTQQGTLVTEVGGASKGEIASPNLCKAFLAVYLDQEAVVARESLLERIHLLFGGPA